MHTQADKKKHQSVTEQLSEKKQETGGNLHFVDNRSATEVQRKLQDAANNNIQVGRLNAYQRMADNYSAYQKKISPPNTKPLINTVQRVQIGQAHNPATHPFANLANYQFATVQAGRTPSYYFSNGMDWVRVRTQHQDGPTLTRQVPRQQFFFATQADMNAMEAYVQRTGSPAGYTGPQLPGPAQGAFHAEWSPGSGFFHRSGGTVDLGVAPTQANLDAITTALTHGAAQIQPGDSAVQLKKDKEA